MDPSDHINVFCSAFSSEMSPEVKYNWHASLDVTVFESIALFIALSRGCNAAFLYSDFLGSEFVS